jgi:hypothetical protein
MCTFRVSATAQMRVLVALVAVALVGLAIGAHSAAAGSKKPGVSISVDLGPASVKVDASSGGADTSVDGSTPAATVDATVDSSVQTPVSVAVDTPTPVAGATVGVADSSAATVSTPAGSTTGRADTTKGVEASVQIKSPVASGKAAVSADLAHAEADITVSTPTGSVGTAVRAASAGASNEGSSAVALPVQAPGAAKPAKPQAVARPAARRTRPAAVAPAHIPLVTAIPRNAVVAGRAGSTPPPGLMGVLASSSRPGAGHAPDAAPSASVTAATWHRPVTTPGTGGASGASGSGLSTVGFFAILTAFLMLAAPIVGRWLRPSIGPALQPAFASLLERPG